MKKKNKFYLLLLCGAIIFMGKGYCLDFSIDNQTYQVNDLETLRDYTYFNLKNQNKLYDYLIIRELDNSYYGYKYTIANFKEYSSITCNSRGRVNFNISSNLVEQQQYRYTQNFTLEYSSNNVGTQVAVYNSYPQTGSNSNPIAVFQNKDVSCTTSGGDTWNISKNFTYDEIECKYHTTDCSTYEEPTPEEPTPTPTPEEYSKEDFYNMGYVGIMAICVLIFMLFFKWCFPMKGGKK